ncbi:MAG TPA: dihydroorotate dehydrogenase, partial [Ruminococcus sp.]|nr:dihydroorotate dehydrogenase [Ruminococcus sp.]
MADLSVKVCGVDFKNPIIPASGVFGYGREYEELFPLSKLGGIATKGTTITRRTGNLSPRIAETPSGILNSVGLQNPGIDYFIDTELPNLMTKDTVIIANIAGSTVDECVTIAKKLDETDVHMIELNISCPNVKQGGAAFGTSCSGAENITAEVRKATKKPLIVKLSPNVTSITDIAKAVESAGADSVSLINTLLGMRIDINTQRPILKNNVGGMSGPAVFPIAVRMVWQGA